MKFDTYLTQQPLYWICSSVVYYKTFIGIPLQVLSKSTLLVTSEYPN